MANDTREDRDDEPPGARPRTDSLLGLLAFLLAITAYIPAFAGSFVWDDRSLLQKPEIETLAPLWEYFTRPFWQDEGIDPTGSVYYRPLVLLSLAVDHALHGANASGYHLINLFAHGANSWLVYALARKVGAARPASLLAALLFAWFPRNTEAVGWISGRTDVLAATFSLSAVSITLGSARSRRGWAALCLLLGLFCKEVAAAACGAVIMYEFTLPSHPLKARIKRLLPVTVAICSYLILRGYALRAATDWAERTNIPRYLAAPAALGRYAAMLLNGWTPELRIGVLDRPSRIYVTLGVITLIALIIVARKVRLGNKQQALLLGAGGALLLVLHLVPIPVTVIAADRFLYLPTALVAPALAPAAAQLARPVLLGLFFLAASYFPVTWTRSQIWGDDIAFWETAAREQQGAVNGSSRVGLAGILVEHGLYEEAEKVAGSVEDDPLNAVVAMRTVAVIAAMDGDFAKALPLLQQTAKAHPVPTFLSGLAQFSAVASDDATAHWAYQQYARMTPAAGPRQKLADELAQLKRRRGELDVPATTVQQQLERSYLLVEFRLYRVALRELVALRNNSELTADHLHGIVPLAFDFGTPEQTKALYERLVELEGSPPEAYALVYAERMASSARLRRVVRELGF